MCLKQECIPVGCVPPAAVAVREGVSTRHPRDQTPPRTRHPPRNQAPRPCGQTHTCKHITLPQTSFASGKKEGSLEWTPLPLQDGTLPEVEDLFCSRVDQDSPWMRAPTLQEGTNTRFYKRFPQDRMKSRRHCPWERIWGMLVFLKFGHFSCELKETWSSGVT